MTCNVCGTVNLGTERDAPQAWKRGSPEADHAPKATPEWARPGGGFNKGRRLRQGGPGIVKDVPPLRECERAPAGTEVEGHARGSRDHRELTAAINLGNLIIPSGTGPGWARPSASCQGEPGIVKDVLTCGNVDAALTAGRWWRAPRVEVRDHRNLNAAINLRNLVMPAGRSRDGPGQEAMGSTGAPASRQGDCGIVPPQKVPPLPRGA